MIRIHRIRISRGDEIKGLGTPGNLSRASRKLSVHPRAPYHIQPKECFNGVDFYLRQIYGHLILPVKGGFLQAFLIEANVNRV